MTWRKRQIATILDQLQTGDNLIVSELSRLGRSMLKCMKILSMAFPTALSANSRIRTLNLNADADA